MDEKKKKFLENLKASLGIITSACEKTGISRTTYRRWLKSDEDFAAEAADITETQVDFVESRLLQAIKDGETTAIIFYLKTKGKHRGYSEKVQPAALPQPPALSVPKDAPFDPKKMKSKISAKKTYLVNLLKKEGKYTAELSMQVQLAAGLLVRTEAVGAEIMDPGSMINVEYSREGNTRESVSPKVKMYMDLVQQSQRALRALGMNTDAKERKTDNDTMSDFLSLMGEE